MRCRLALELGCFWVLTLWSFCGAGEALRSASRTPNFARNPSFEEAGKAGPLPAAWQGSADVYSRDATMAHTGAASLKFANMDPKRYELAVQKVTFEPGRKYDFSAWIKTKDIKGKDSGASICLEFFRDQKFSPNYLWGWYPSGIKGTRDWTQIRGSAYAPPEAKMVRLVCYVRKGMTGTAWFDDVEIRRIIDPPMSTILLSPSYRGRIAAAGPQTIRVRVKLNPAEHDFRLEEVRLLAELMPRDGTRVLKRTRARPRDRTEELSVPAGALQPGEYVVRVSLTDSGGKKILARREHPVRRLPDNFKPSVTIDEHRRLLVKGKPFFPLGMYWSAISEKDIKLYADSKFNCLMPYGRPTKKQMDLAHRYGLKVIYSLKDFYFGTKWRPKFIKSEADEEPAVRKYVREFRGHPALLAWYLNDELPPTPRYLPRLEAHQRWVEEEDPNHPTWVVVTLALPLEISAYLNSFDVFGTDPYPIPLDSASRAGRWTRRTVTGVGNARPVWMVPQVFNEVCYNRKGRTPTLDEMRSMAWQCICEGATGLIFYSFFDIKRDPDTPFETQWERCKKIAAEIDAMAPILLSLEPVPEVKIEAGGWLRWLAKRHDGKLYIIAVSDGDGEGKVTFRLASAPRSIKVRGENRSLTPTGASFLDNFEKLAVHIYEVE